MLLTEQNGANYQGKPTTIRNGTKNKEEEHTQFTKLNVISHTKQSKMMDKLGIVELNTG